MYVILEYLAYLAGVTVLATALFGATALFYLTQAGAKRLTKTSRRVAANAVAFVAARLEAGRLLHRNTDQHKQ